MGNESYKPTHAREAGVVSLFGSFATTTGGAVGSQSAKGFEVQKTASEVGRYTLMLDSAYPALLGASVMVQKTGDDPYGAGGIVGFVRDVDTKQKSVIIQFAGAAGADAEIPDGVSVFITLTLKNSTAW